MTVFQLACGHLSNGPSCLICHSRTPKKSASRRKKQHSITETTRYAGTTISYATAEAQRQKVLAAVRENGELTRDGIEVATGLKSQTITWRVSELIQSKQLIELQRTALTRSRRPARVLVLPDRADEERTLFS